MAKKYKEIEINSDDVAQSTVYLPENNPDNKNLPDLICDYDAYSFIENISLEWPAQAAIFINDNTIAAGLNSRPSEKSSLLVLNVEDIENFSVAGQLENIDINRLKFFDGHIYACGDKMVAKIDRDLNINKLEGEFSYGFDVCENFVAVGDNKGNIKIFDQSLKSIKTKNIHENSINCIKIVNNKIYTGSDDGFLRCFDDKLELIFEKNFEADVNSFDINIDESFVVVGDDSGILHLLNLKDKTVEEIEWHKTPASYVKFSKKDAEVFYSCCSEQVCVWDKSFCDEWEYHKYLQFVHMGDKEYKKIDEAENGNILVSGSNGLCVFKQLEDEEE